MALLSLLTRSAFLKATELKRCGCRCSQGSFCYSFFKISLRRLSKPGLIYQLTFPKAIFMTSIFNLTTPLLSTEAPPESLVIAGVLLSLVAIYTASKVGGELSRFLDLPPVLGELIAGVVVGISALHLIVFPDSGGTADSSAIMSVLSFLEPLSAESLQAVFSSQSEVLSVLAELGVIVLLFEIGLESEVS